MVNVFSFCLYGPENPMYYRGLLENVYLAAHYFPDWKVYVYLGQGVTADMQSTLQALPTVVVRFTGAAGALNMIHRFYAIDEEDVDLMIVRDADSRIHWKDRWAIRQFAHQPQFACHIVRDNKVHNVRMMGGLWGIRASAGIDMHTEYEEFCKHPRDHGAGHDQSFLAERIYPRVAGRILTHYSHGLVYSGEVGVEFPFAWSTDTFCGRPESDLYIDRPEPQQELRVQREGLVHRRTFTSLFRK